MNFDKTIFQIGERTRNILQFLYVENVLLKTASVHLHLSTCPNPWAHYPSKDCQIPIQPLKNHKSDWEALGGPAATWKLKNARRRLHHHALAFSRTLTYNILSLIFHPWASVFYLNGELVFQSRRTADCTRVVVKLMPEMHTPSEMQIMLLFRPARAEEKFPRVSICRGHIYGWRAAKTPSRMHQRIAFKIYDNGLKM